MAVCGYEAAFYEPTLAVQRGQLVAMIFHSLFVSSDASLSVVTCLPPSSLP